MIQLPKTHKELDQAQTLELLFYVIVKIELYAGQYMVENLQNVIAEESDQEVKEFLNAAFMFAMFCQPGPRSGNYGNPRGE